MSSPGSGTRPTTRVCLSGGCLVRSSLFPMSRDAGSHLPACSAVSVPADRAIPLYAALSADPNVRFSDVLICAASPSEQLQFTSLERTRVRRYLPAIMYELCLIRASGWRPAMIRVLLQIRTTNKGGANMSRRRTVKALVTTHGFQI